MAHIEKENVIKCQMSRVDRRRWRDCGGLQRGRRRWYIAYDAHADAASLSLDAVHARCLAQSGKRFVRGGFAVGQSHERMLLLEGVDLLAHEQTPMIENTDTVRHGLHVGEDVGGEEDGLACGRHLTHQHVKK